MILFDWLISTEAKRTRELTFFVIGLSIRRWPPHLARRKNRCLIYRKPNADSNMSVNKIHMH